KSPIGSPRERGSCGSSTRSAGSHGSIATTAARPSCPPTAASMERTCCRGLAAFSNPYCCQPEEGSLLARLPKILHQHDVTLDLIPAIVQHPAAVPRHIEIPPAGHPLPHVQRADHAGRPRREIVEPDARRAS